MIDLLAVSIATVVLVLVVGALLAVGEASPDGVLARVLPPATGLMVFVGYFAVLERRGTLDRPNRGTLGKAAFKLAVVTREGNALQPFPAILRQLAKIPASALFLLTLFTPQGRALHDWIAGSRVIRKSALPRSA